MTSSMSNKIGVDTVFSEKGYSMEEMAEEDTFKQKGSRIIIDEKEITSQVLQDWHINKTIANAKDLPEGISLIAFPSKIAKPQQGGKLEKLVIINNTDSMYAYDPSAMIEYYNAGKWIQPKKKSSKKDFLTAYELIALYVYPRSEVSTWVAFFPDYYDYVAGKYRVVKTIRNSITQKKQKIYTEFYIE